MGSFSPIVTTISMLVIVGIILYLSFLFTRYVGVKTMGRGISKHMKMVDVLPISQERSVIIIEVSEKFYMLGVSDGGIQLLKEFDSLPDLSNLDMEKKVDFKASFMDVIAKAKKK
ncbi:MAG: flagellar biosynthetic protein FliO [Bacillota bacterium]